MRVWKWILLLGLGPVFTADVLLLMLVAYGALPAMVTVQETLFWSGVLDLSVVLAAFVAANA